MRLHSVGPGLGTVATFVEMTAGGGAAVGLTLETSIVRTTPYSYKASGLTSGLQQWMAHRFAAAGANGPFYKRIYFYPGTLPAAENTILSFYREGDGLNKAWITVDQNGVLRLRDEDGLIGSPSPALATGSFENCIELLIDLTAAAGSHVVRGRLNGVEFAGSATRSIGLNVDGIRIGANLNFEAQTVGEWYFADIAINDGTTSVQNSFPGPGGLIYLFPIGAGDAAPTAGTFADIDEVPPNDATDFIEIDTAIAANFEFQKWADKGRLATDRITLVHVGTRCRAETAASAGWIPQLKSQPGGTTFDGSATTKDDTAFSSNGDVVPRNYKLTSTTDPQDGTPWTPAKIDTLRAGVNVTDATPDVHFTTIYVVVELVPAITATLGLATETDTALPITVGKAFTLGLAVETDNAQSVTQGGLTATIGQAVEADTAQPLTATKVKAIGQASESDTALGLTAAERYAIGLATETDTAFPVTAAAPGIIGTASELDTAFPITVAKRAAIGLSTETDTAFALTTAKARAIATATETDTAFPITTPQRVTIGQATETDTAQPVTPARVTLLGIATETDTGFAFTHAHQVRLGLAIETDLALAMVAAGGIPPVLLVKAGVAVLTAPGRRTATMTAAGWRTATWEITAI